MLEITINWTNEPGTRSIDLILDTKYPPEAKTLEEYPPTSSFVLDSSYINYATVYYWQVICHTVTGLDIPLDIETFTTPFPTSTPDEDYPEDANVNFNIKNQNDNFYSITDYNEIKLFFKTRNKFRGDLSTYTKYYNFYYMIQKGSIATPLQIFIGILTDYAEKYSLDPKKITRANVLSKTPNLCISQLLSNTFLKKDGTRFLPGSNTDPYISNLNEVIYNV